MLSLEDIFAHFPGTVSKEMAEFAKEEAFKWSRYIFTRREGKRQYGYCTHCGREFRTEGLRHNDKTTCPECSSVCTVKASGRGRKAMIDQVYFVWYDKSILNPDAIVATGIYAVRDYRENYYRVETQFTTRALYVFEPGRGGHMVNRSAWYSDQYGECRVGAWTECKSVFSMFNYGFLVNVATCYSRQSIEAAVKDTPFRYSTWQEYNFEDMTKFFDLYAKYPCVEYLTKLGMQHLVGEKLEGGATYSAINWRGKDLLRVLRLTKQELNEIRKRNIHVTFFLLKVIQLNRKNGWNLSLSEVLEVINFDHAYYFNELLKLLEYGSIKKIIGYLNKQYTKYRKHYYQKSAVLTAWRDYITDCKKLEFDLTNESVLFPKNVYNAHQNTIKQVKIKTDKELDEKIRGLVKELNKKYFFKHKGLIIRPATGTQELINEGKALEHCVGGYAKKHANGETAILFIRKVSEPDKPYFTAEVIKDRVVQVRGKKNCEPDKAVDEFMGVFSERKLKKIKAKTKLSA